MEDMGDTCEIGEMKNMDDKCEVWDKKDKYEKDDMPENASRRASSVPVRGSDRMTG